MIASTGRRAALAALVAGVAGMVAPIALAQDPRAAAAQAAARDWLAIVDRYEVDASFQGADEKFRQALTLDGWTRAVKSVREPLGAVVQRTAGTTDFTNQLPGHPPGEYVLLGFRTSFANRPVARELVTLQVVDYRWRVVGYTIQQ